MKALLTIIGICLLAPAIGQIAKDKPKFLGNIYSSNQIEQFENYWNQVTPENAGKWGSVERNRDSYNFTELDNAYALAEENGWPFRFHVLVWGNQQPGWIEDLPREEQLEEIKEWMDTIAARYPNIAYLEVANEPINDPPNKKGSGGGNYMEALGGKGITGYDWIVTAFELAKERFPNAKLMINEYNIMNSSSRSSQYKVIVELLQSKGLIDVIGVQAHAFTTTAESSVMSSILDKLADTGLPIMVTEMDIDGPSDQVQLDEYKRIFPIFWEHEAVIGVTLWGWRPGLWRNEQKAYLVDDATNERPALQWLRNYVTAWEPVDPNVLNAESAEIQLFPNPVTNGKLSLSTQRPLTSANLYDIGGQLLKVYTLTENPRALELEINQPAGTYLLELLNEQDTISTHKVVIQ
ncbi:endo-1,4-beta-xylanase [Marinoscillum furvescens]|uniref:endo-1,4-beta-xylanase n=1 Tax=Marinoscillum furvescens DSM 4134 TaxID=1122208 RepID=A0A3D9L4V8_MARFU|nr:endo-1,4-beta-xylanase [Marinoscillum furvescens]REE01053.1 endo-1,4-beta-xylanase [Marinoscillum furvescens DSM 4134]